MPLKTQLEFDIKEQGITIKPPPKKPKKKKVKENG